MQLQAMSPEEVKSTGIYREWGLRDDEYNLVVDILGRQPNYTETGLFSVMWSEHCSYKNSKPVLKTFYTEGDQVLQGPGEGAGIVDIGDEQAVVFKTESHNHPSAVEPYEGAATGIGGILRDIFSMGARPIAALDSLRFGELTDNHTKYIFNGVVSGIAGYGNCIGVPTVGGETKFDASYKGNPLVNAMAVGLIDHKDIQAGRASGVGNTVMYVGADTGRDGIHGATFSSEEFSDENETQRSAVQVGDPFKEKMLMEACLELITEHTDKLVGIQDMGAAGLVSSSSEMASKANSGLELILDLVPQREENMSAYEILLSESQERMLLCVKKGYEQDVQDLFAKYDLYAVEVGKVVEGNNYTVKFHGEVVADVPVDSLAEDAPVYENEAVEPARLAEFRALDKFIPQVESVKETLETLLQTADLASKESIYNQYDSRVRTNTVVGPGSDAAVLRIRGTKKALAMTIDCNARYIYLDPYQGGQIAVAEASRNIIASGGYPLAITDCLNYGNPEKPEIFYELKHSALGISEACKKFDSPVISGNVSLYNENADGAIYPTPTIGMVGLIKDTKHILTQTFKQAGDSIYLVGQTKDDFSGSAIQKLQHDGKISGTIDFDLDTEHVNQQLVFEANQASLLQSAHDLSEGGLAIALVESVFNTPFSMDITTELTEAQLFSETQSRFVVSVAAENVAAFEELVASSPVVKIGQVTDTDTFKLQTSQSETVMSKQALEKLWKEALPNLLK